MLFPALIIVFVVGAAFGEKKECQQQVRQKCNVSNIPEEIPETIHDLKRDCKVLQDTVKCAADENENCEEQAFESTKLRKLHNFMESNCDEGSSLYQALSLNYVCIQPIAKNLGDQCLISEEDWAKMINLLSESKELSNNATYCQYPLYEIVCISHIVGMHCGQQAKEAVSEILLNMKWNFRDCNEESILKELQPLKEAFESTFSEALELENAMLKEMKDVLNK